MVWAIISSREPSYHGKTLSEWLYRHQSFGLPRSFDPDSETAVQTIGVDALPILVGMVAARDDSWKTILMEFARRIKLSRSTSHQADEKHLCAAYGFEVLGARARPAVPRLVRLTKSEDVKVRWCALICLSWIYEKNSDGTEMWPILEPCLRDSDASIRKLTGLFMNYYFPESGTNKIVEGWYGSGPQTTWPQPPLEFFAFPIEP